MKQIDDYDCNTEEKLQGAKNFQRNKRKLQGQVEGRPWKEPTDLVTHICELCIKKILKVDELVKKCEPAFVVTDIH